MFVLPALGRCGCVLKAATGLDGIGSHAMLGWVGALQGGPKVAAQFPLLTSERFQKKIWLFFGRYCGGGKVVKVAGLALPACPFTRVHACGMCWLS